MARPGLAGLTQLPSYAGAPPPSPRDYNNFGAPPDRNGYTPLVTSEFNPPSPVQAAPPTQRTAEPPSSSPAAQLDMIQFSCAIYIVNVDEGKLSADIMRMGKMAGQLKFKYETIGASARAGVQFEHCQGTLVMEPGQDSAIIEVPIISSDRWSPTTEFCISLTDPEGCTLGMYLKVARVKVLDASTFPLDKFKEDVKTAEGIEAINQFELFGGFVFQMWSQDGIKWRTITTVCLDQLHNVYVYLRLVLAIYMVDKVFNMDNHKDLMVPGNRLLTAWAVAGLIIGPMFILYAAEMIKIRMDIKGILQRDLSRNLFRKFMNYSKQSREDIPSCDCVTALTQDAATVVQGYSDVLRIIQLGGKVAISIFFTLSQNPSAWWACLLVPGIMFGWGKLRMEVYIKANQNKGDCESGIIAFVNEVLNKLTLIADYAQRPQMNELFAEKSEGLRNMQTPAHFVTYNNMFVPEVLGPALVALYTGVGAALVLNNQVGLGVYLATISVFGDICGAFESCFGRVMDVISTFIPLAAITLLLNKATDVPAVKAVNRQRRLLTKEFRAEMIKAQKANPTPHVEGEAFVPAADKLDIKLIDVVFAHPGGEPCFHGVSFTCPQGSINALHGEPGKGRRSLLELIAHKMFPDTGTLFIPSHLRILYVSAESVLLNLSVWQNLAFGNSKGNNPYRVEKILQALKMDQILGLVAKDLATRKKQFDGGGDDAEEEEPEEQQGTNPLEKLRGSQKANIHFARALIMNPEIMCFNRPFMNYPKVGASSEAGEDQATLVAKILVQHRDNRGFAMDPADKMNRRPRTIFFTPDAPAEAGIADMVIMLPSKVGGECWSAPPDEAWPSVTGPITQHAYDTGSKSTAPQLGASMQMPPGYSPSDRPMQNMSYLGYQTAAAPQWVTEANGQYPGHDPMATARSQSPQLPQWTERDFQQYQQRKEEKRFCCG